MLLSLLLKNLPRMFTPSTRRPESASISRIVSTASYKIEFPTFFDDSVFVATCARMSLICSLVAGSPRPSTRKSCRILTCRKGSVMPETSCSGAYPELVRALSVRTNAGTTGRNISTTPISPPSASSSSHILVTSVRPQSSTPWFLS